MIAVAVTSANSAGWSTACDGNSSSHDCIGLLYIVCNTAVDGWNTVN